jgi:acyl-coenzyme A synthetase/AMP-(fatty) acid ligase
MTTTGKIQRRVLRQLEIGRSQRQAKKLKAQA